jgi:predicted Fe-Mo cluster-binding NifX family protein
MASDGSLINGWGRAPRVAVATVTDGTIDRWQELDVRWDVLHDEGTGGQHHARIARFLREHDIALVVVGHMGEGMVRMLATMGIGTTPATGTDPRAAVLMAVSAAAGRPDPGTASTAATAPDTGSPETHSESSAGGQQPGRS